MHRAVVVFAALLGLVAVIATPATAPAYLASATSDSMAPTIGSGDGYVVVAPGDVEEGDVVVFRSAELGGYVTHRVVAAGPDGLVTKGDANPVADQDAGLAPVPRSAVVGRVLTIGGEVVVLPGLGAVIRAVDDHSVAVLALVAAAGVLVGVRDRRRRNPRKRPVLRVGDVVPPLLAGAIALSLAVVLLSSSSHVVFLQGELASAETATVTVDGGVTPLSHLVVEGEGVAVEDQSVRDGQLRLVLSVPPERQGTAARVRVRPYPRTLPRDQVAWLDRVHPLLAAVASVGVIIGPLVLAYWLLVDPRQPLRAPASWRAG